MTSALYTLSDDVDVDEYARRSCVCIRDGNATWKEAKHNKVEGQLDILS